LPFSVSLGNGKQGVEFRGEFLTKIAAPRGRLLAIAPARVDRDQRNHAIFNAEPNRAAMFQTQCALNDPWDDKATIGGDSANFFKNRHWKSPARESVSCADQSFSDLIGCTKVAGPYRY
jgi:hypothetical protein